MSSTSTDLIQKQIQIAAPLERVWRALSDSIEFGAWFGVALEGPFVAGQSVQGRMTGADCGNALFEADVVRVDAQSDFAFRWHPFAVDPSVDYSAEPTTLVEFHLEAKDAETQLTITESGFDAIPEHRRAEAFAMHEQGWIHQSNAIAQHIRG